MKKFTITIGIPAYNEQKNVKNLLLSLLKQKQSNFDLKKIILYSDASTDKTNEIVQQLQQKFPIIQFIKGTSQKGKYKRINQIFSMSKTEAVIILDADIIIVGDKFLENLVKVLIQDPKSLLVAAHQKMIRPKSFIGKMIYTNFLHWDYIRWSIPDYHNGNNYYGSATAYRGSFARSIKIPDTTNDPHFYIYLLADKQDGFRYCPKAEIKQWPISTMQDLNKFCRRSIGKPDNTLAQIFGQEHINAAKSVSHKSKIIGTLRCIVEEPVFTPLSFFILLYIKYASRYNTDKTARWEIVTSTKQYTKNRK